MVWNSMRLRILLPSHSFADTQGVLRIVAETHDGAFGILPNRLDCVAALSPGILVYETSELGEVYVALDEGVLVKTGSEVCVSVRRAINGADLAQLQQAVQKEFVHVDTGEREQRAVMAKLEAGFLRQFAGLHHD